ncbi:MAG TPA: DNA cytosine methyltransferase [Candidatus Obscuribacter sp.]|nr:DNA cytosine methyltransferase [Candidatus Obscuribacter sp.]HMX44554.1 DNA cytosine methyltransferase [Candidatus Obscuribacter sp.]HMY01986.1 DNA cytosine methyltransferase [Candidatus Obscuribacter sp.]HMY52787.1 DNA cytosine methyltransferase [Candidatus Obscuribacter sp.]HNA74242.1 DNA cytosine methyltransferase [Candidatus Obscuribacter sp.]
MSDSMSKSVNSESDCSPSRIKALEFFSGIGAFSQAVLKRKAEPALQVLKAFDQNEHANRVFSANYGHTPCSVNLDSISAAQINKGLPLPADLWWMSPPCTPYSRRGKRKDMEDPRAVSFLHLLDLLPQFLPTFLFIENVEGLENTRMEEHLLECLQKSRYCFEKVALCPSQFGVPMLRPRLFYMAWLQPSCIKLPPLQAVPECERKLSAYLEPAEPVVLLGQEELARYGNVLNIVDPEQPEARAICFTSGYFRCRKAAGSLLGGREPVRFFSPREILNLLGFCKNFILPADLSLNAAYRMVGNSVDVRSIEYLLSGLMPEGAPK